MGKGGNHHGGVGGFWKCYTRRILHIRVVKIIPRGNTQDRVSGVSKDGGSKGPIQFSTKIDQNQWRIQDLPEGVHQPRGKGRQHTISPIFLENCMKIKKNWQRGGGARPLSPQLRSVTKKHWWI